MIKDISNLISSWRWSGRSESTPHRYCFADVEQRCPSAVERATTEADIVIRPIWEDVSDAAPNWPVASAPAPGQVKIPRFRDHGSDGDQQRQADNGLARPKLADRSGRLCRIATHGWRARADAADAARTPEHQKTPEQEHRKPGKRYCWRARAGAAAARQLFWVKRHSVPGELRRDDINVCRSPIRRCLAVSQVFRVDGLELRFQSTCRHPQIA